MPSLGINNQSQCVNDPFLDENNKTPLSFIYDGSFEDNNDTILNSTVIEVLYPTGLTSKNGINNETNADIIGHK